VIMRVKEGCFAIPLSQYINSDKNLIEYIRRLFELSHSEPIYIAIEPAVITIKMGFRKIWISIEPGSAIICNRSLAELFNESIEIVEDVWIETEILIPYTYEELCGLTKILNIPIDIDEEIGINHLCITSKSINIEELKRVINGGLIELVDVLYSSGKLLEIKPRKNKLFIILKGMGINNISQLESSQYSYIEIPNEMKIFIEDLIYIDDKPIVMGIGKGYISLFTSIEPYTAYIYTALLLSTYTTPSSSPRAKVFISRISSTVNEVTT